MPKYEAKNEFHRIESKVLIIENDNNAPALVGWLMEKLDTKKEKVMEVRKDIEALAYGYNDPNISNDEIKEEMKKLADRLYKIMCQ